MLDKLLLQNGPQSNCIDKKFSAVMGRCADLQTDGPSGFANEIANEPRATTIHTHAVDALGLAMLDDLPEDLAKAAPLTDVTSPFRWLARHPALCLILFSSFVARLFLAGWSSYGYDELLSVVMYGTNHATLFSAISALAAQSAHPPLFHIVLFYWMQLFGDGEIATRTLSNLYITGATFCLYVLALKLFGRRVAITSALIFTFSYTAIGFGQEVRSYAQSLFLVTLSSLMMLRWLERVDRTLPWRNFFAGRGAALLLCNIALSLTHYANALFLLVQALFTGFVLWRQNRPALFQPLTKTFIFYIVQFAVPFALWGSIALSTGSRFVGNKEFALEGLPTRNPLSIFMDMIVRPNFDLPSISYLILLVLLAIVLVKVAIRYVVDFRGAPPLNAYFLFYLVAWAILPCVILYLIFVAADAERYNIRYFAFCFPPLSILLVLAVEQLVESLNAALRAFGFSVNRHYLRNALPYAFAICAIFALPGGYAAATHNKEPFREIARSIVSLVDGDQKSSFAIYEAAHRSEPMLNFYMKRMSKRVRVDGTIRRDVERGNPLADAQATIDARDYLVIAFPHLRPEDFPLLMQRLQNEYDLVVSQLTERGFGFIVLKARVAKSLPPKPYAVPD